MKTVIFLAIVLVSGAIAGTIHGMTNLVMVEPYLDEAIGIENQNLFASGEEEDTPQFWVEYNSYRDWQKGGQVLAGAILGTSVGALFGIVYALSRHALPGKNDLRKTLVLAGIMWLTIYLIPFLKYPANPPTVGDGETVVLRAVLYLSFIAISGFGAVGLYQLYKRLKQNTKVLAFVGYAVFIGIVFALMPPNPDEVTAPMDLVDGFRAMSAVAVSVFWVSVAVVLGSLWHKFRPDSEITLAKNQ
ncbi:putative cobalt transporter subunit protein [Marine Group I thaumarchaeote SCGC RSA3]|nr:putative cobalt transporter subunit protein [Marine Group I thaumarchaeote SCGC AAA799-N04]KFM16257.1 putative cobalt transporter subunit protein [Marine Group I thaumarchaeote SCGC AAA799-D11]KFM16466.1 putative cobalt transporter subunit protein [Marine Group I thaumarchaeote SCGC RSA3]